MTYLTMTQFRRKLGAYLANLQEEPVCLTMHRVPLVTITPFTGTQPTAFVEATEFRGLLTNLVQNCQFRKRTYGIVRHGRPIAFMASVS